MGGYNYTFSYHFRNSWVKLWGMLIDVKEQFFLHCFGQKELFSQFLLQCYFFRGTVPLFLSNIGGTVPLSLSKIGGTVPLFLVRLG